MVTIDALDVLCAQLTRGLFAIGKFVVDDRQALYGSFGITRASNRCATIASLARQGQLSLDVVF